MNDERNFPDIEFVETDTTELINSLVAAYEKITGSSLAPASPERLFIMWVADIIVQQRVIINWAAKQNIPRYASGVYLDSLGSCCYNDNTLYDISGVNERTAHSGRNTSYHG